MTLINLKPIFTIPWNCYTLYFFIKTLFMELQFILPIAVMIFLFILVQFITKRNLLNNNIFIRVRILLGCVFLGFLVSELSRAESTRSVVTLTLLTGLILYGTYRLHKKYFVLKNSK